MSQAVASARALNVTGFSGTLVLNLPHEFVFNEDAFYDFCRANAELRIERTAEGGVIVMPPTGWGTGERNAELTTQVRLWAKADGRGAAADSSAGYILPNGAERAPDASWIRRERLAQLTAEQRRKFLPLCPDFAVELMSPTDRLAVVQAKLEEYIANGAQLGWLLDPDNRTVYVYRPNLPVEKFENVLEVSGEPELPGFVLQLAEIWEPSI